MCGLGFWAGLGSRVWLCSCAGLVWAGLDCGSGLGWASRLDRGSLLFCPELTFPVLGLFWAVLLY